MNKKKFLFLSAALAAVCMTSCIDNEEPDGLRALREGLGEKYKQEGQAAVISANAELASVEVDKIKAEGQAKIDAAKAAKQQAEAAKIAAEQEVAAKQAEAKIARDNAESAAKIANDEALNAAKVAAELAKVAQSEAATQAEIEKAKALQAEAEQNAALAAVTAAQAALTLQKAEEAAALAEANLLKTIAENETAIAEEKVAQQRQADALAAAILDGQTTLLASQQKLETAQKDYEANKLKLATQLAQAAQDESFDQADNYIKYLEKLQGQIDTKYELYVKASEAVYDAENKHLQEVADTQMKELDKIEPDEIAQKVVNDAYKAEQDAKKLQMKKDEKDELVAEYEALAALLGVTLNKAGEVADLTPLTAQVEEYDEMILALKDSLKSISAGGLEYQLLTNVVAAAKDALKEANDEAKKAMKKAREEANEKITKLQSDMEDVAVSYFNDAKYADKWNELYKWYNTKGAAFEFKLTDDKNVESISGNSYFNAQILKIEGKTIKINPAFESVVPNNFMYAYSLDTASVKNKPYTIAPSAANIYNFGSAVISGSTGYYLFKVSPLLGDFYPVDEYYTTKYGSVAYAATDIQPQRSYWEWDETQNPAKKVKKFKNGAANYWYNGEWELKEYPNGDKYTSKGASYSVANPVYHLYCAVLSDSVSVSKQTPVKGVDVVALEKGTPVLLPTEYEKGAKIAEIGAADLTYEKLKQRKEAFEKEYKDKCLGKKDPTSDKMWQLYTDPVTGRRYVCVLDADKKPENYSSEMTALDLYKVEKDMLSAYEARLADHVTILNTLRAEILNAARQEQAQRDAIRLIIDSKKVACATKLDALQADIKKEADALNDLKNEEFALEIAYQEALFEADEPVTEMEENAQKVQTLIVRLGGIRDALQGAIYDLVNPLVTTIDPQADLSQINAKESEYTYTYKYTKDSKSNLKPDAKNLTLQEFFDEFIADYGVYVENQVLALEKEIALDEAALAVAPEKEKLEAEKKSLQEAIDALKQAANDNEYEVKLAGLKLAEENAKAMYEAAVATYNAEVGKLYATAE